MYTYMRIQKHKHVQTQNTHGLTLAALEPFQIRSIVPNLVINSSTQKNLVRLSPHKTISESQILSEFIQNLFQKCTHGFGVGGDSKRIFDI